MQSQEYLDFVRALISLQSHTPLSSQVPEFLCQTLERYGIKPKIVESHGIKNIVAQTGDTPILLLNGHWDTVLPNESFRTDTISAEIKDGNLYGLGACDMKSGAAAMVAALIDCHKAGVDGVTLCLVGDEEAGGKDGTGLLVSRGHTAPYVVLGEPTAGNISLGQKGGLEVRVHTQGIAGHGAYPQRGDNAIIKMNQYLSQVNLALPVPSKDISLETLFHSTTATISMITGGSAPNVIPAECSATIDVRIPPNESFDKTKDIFDVIAQSIPGTTLEFEIFGEGWELDTKSHLYDVTSAVMTKQYGAEVPFVRKMGSNDGKYYAAKGCEIINVGPGDNKLSHTDHEVVTVDDIHRYRKVYFELTQKLTATA